MIEIVNVLVSIPRKYSKTPLFALFTHTVSVFLQLSVNPPKLTVGNMCSVEKGDAEKAAEKLDTNISKCKTTTSKKC